MRNRIRCLEFLLPALGLFCADFGLAADAAAPETPEPSATAVQADAKPIRLKAVEVVSGEVFGVEGEASLRVMNSFLKKHPNVTLLPATGIQIPGRSFDTQPLMQIAGDVSPDVIYVNFRQSETYIRNKFLYPLDKLFEKSAGMELKDGHLLDTDAYYKEVCKAKNFETEVEERFPRIVWDVIRRECPYGTDCSYVKEWGETSADHHSHIWAVPSSQLVMALFYRKDLFSAAGLPDRVPETCDELMEWARKLTNPEENVFGLSLPVWDTGWSTLSFLYSYGGLVVDRDEQGQWRCVFDSPEAADAYTFVARLYGEPFTNEHGTFQTCVDTGQQNVPGRRNAMWFTYLNQRAFSQIDPNTVGFGPVPKGPTGMRGSEYNCQMLGLYAGNVDNNVPLREVAWDYAWFFGGHEANIIRAQTYVENGLGRFVNPRHLRAAGFVDEAENVPPGWESAQDEAMARGIPEPYGRNCQLVYTYLSRAIDQLRNDRDVLQDIRKGDYASAREKVAQILKDRVALADVKMLGYVPPEVMRFRRRVAAVVVVLIAVLFALVLRHVLRTFAAATAGAFRRKKQEETVGVAPGYGLARLLLLPALLTIAIWSYYPLARGTVMAFQDYNVRGFSEFTGLENFATVLFNPEFWHSIWISLKYTILSILFGFVAPIILALLLSEVPRGKILFRTIYYLPAVLSGVVVMFLWKGFYSPYGVINGLVNGVLHFLNSVFGTEFADLTMDWLATPETALFCCLLPTIWAGMGPGCLIYLAALKTVPDDLYEAADIEGAGVWCKVWHISLPSIRALIGINFIGAVIGAMKSGSEFMLAMTGGGPYRPYGATEVIGLHIFWEAFGYLRFGSATAMAWVLGSMLIGFTMLQLQRLSKLEFRTAARVLVFALLCTAALPSLRTSAAPPPSAPAGAPPAALVSVEGSMDAEG